ncbi:MAG TPA: Lrp/AsnC family transcriptional regulator [Paucimonas sp.]|nr:Lrp/AsnC family transcriptional regulator [Paucimonas sp.]
MTVQLDAIDRKIIDELIADARVPIATLAVRVGLSRHAVRHRIDRLEAHKVIAGYTIRLTERARGAPLARAIMMVYRKDRIRGADVTTAIAAIPEVTHCFVLSGAFDLIVYIEADSHERVNNIWAQIAALPGVADIVTNFALASVLDRRH